MSEETKKEDEVRTADILIEDSEAILPNIRKCTTM